MTRLLSNGRYTVLATDAGTGCSRFDELALTAWSADPTEDADGVFVYLRDQDSDAVWSAGAQPIARAAERYETGARPGVATIVRVDDGIETSTELCVARDDVELRRVRLRNLSGRPRRLALTSYAEVVLNHPAAHAAHPGFSKLFVQTEYAPAASAVLAHRRPRSSTEHTAWMFHGLVGDGSLEHETDRARFLGRGHAAADPAALGTPLSNTTGNVLDPVFALRRTVALAAGGEAELTLVLGAGETRERVVELARRYAAPAQVASAFAAAEDAERELWRRLGIGAAEAARFDALAVAFEYGDPRLTAGARASARGADVCARLGLSAVRRTLVVEAPEIATAIAYWQAKCVHIETLLLHDGAAAPSMPGLTARRRAEVSADDLAALQALGHAVVMGPTLHVTDPPPAPRGRWHRAPAGDSRPSTAATMLFDNGYGGFAPDGSEYVMRVGERRPPMPWVNVVANERFGFLVSEAGAGYTWSRNSRENRLTPWYNDPIADPHGEALYLRDEDDGVFWSPLPGPVAPAPIEARHGFGYSTWRHTSRELEQDVCMFVPRSDPVRVVRVRVTNRGARVRRLSLFSYARLVLGVLPAESGRSVETWQDAASGALCARNPLNGDFAGAIVFAAAVAPGPVHATADRTAFLGRHGTPADPAALRHAATLDGRTGAGLDPCAALQAPVTVAPGASIECDFLLGEVASEGEVRALVARYREAGAIARALDEIRDFWRTTLSAVRVETPAPGLDVVLNGWLVYQNMSCRLWGRSAFYQSGGAFGFRDQLQDSAALVYTRPDLTRAQIVLHAGHQFVEGDVLHWWHPPSDRGTRTRFSDDLVWLPYVTAFYVATTGDASVLDEPAPFLTARLLAPGEDEAYLLPSLSGESADVYGHCCRVLDRALTRGAHGLPLMGTGDWNDGMNRVGREGRGESVWLGFFLYRVLGDFIPLCERRGDDAHVRRYREYRSSVQAALESAAWDGAWYRRAYYDDGTPLGSASNDECRIDALAQAWAVISKAAPSDRAALGMDAVERELVDDEAGLIRLLAPPFDRTAHDPGYIKGYVPGIRENGGQYTHAALWVIRALAELGRRERAATLLEKIGPVAHTTPALVARYQVEPYVVVADIYGTPPHVGRGGWTWYTGSAGWMYRVALESVLGLTIHDGRTLRLAPRVPDGWPRFAVSLRLRDGRTRYEIEVRNPTGNAAAVATASVDGRPVPVEDGAASIALAADGAVHHVVATLGASALG